MIELLKRVLSEAAEKTGINFIKVNNLLKCYASDKRYKVIVNAASCVWNSHQTGIITYKNIKYYYEQNPDGVRVEVYRR